MAKLEEISELLVSEIRDFEVVVKKLEEIQKKKISLDNSELQRSLAKLEKILTTESDTEKRLRRVEVVIGKANIYPKWAVVIFVVSLLLNCISAVVILSSLRL